MALTFLISGLFCMLLLRRKGDYFKLFLQNIFHKRDIFRIQMGNFFIYKPPSRLRIKLAKILWIYFHIVNGIFEENVNEFIP